MGLEMIGWGSSGILLATLMRQVYTQWRTRSTAGVSKWLFIGQLAASIGYTIYSFLLHNWVFLSSNIAILCTAVLGEALYFRNRRLQADGRTGSVERTSASASRVRCSRRRKYLSRKKRRVMMKASRRAMPTSETTTAWKTKPAGPSQVTNLETKSIGHAKTCLRAALRAVLIEEVAADVLPRCELPAQAAAPGARGEAAELIGAREILAAHGEEDVAVEVRHEREF